MGSDQNQQVRPVRPLQDGGGKDEGKGHGARGRGSELGENWV